MAAMVRISSVLDFVGCVFRSVSSVIEFPLARWCLEMHAINPLFGVCWSQLLLSSQRLWLVQISPTSDTADAVLGFSGEAPSTYPAVLNAGRYCPLVHGALGREFEQLWTPSPASASGRGCPLQYYQRSSNVRRDPCPSVAPSGISIASSTPARPKSRCSTVRSVVRWNQLAPLNRWTRTHASNPTSESQSQQRTAIVTKRLSIPMWRKRTQSQSQPTSLTNACLRCAMPSMNNQ